MQKAEDQLNLKLSEKEKIFCLKDINKKLIRCLYVYEQEKEQIENYDYKNYLEQKSMETKTFDEIINAVYKESQEETISVLNKNKLFKKKPKL